MGTGNFTDDFKRDAVAQITERGYRVCEVSERLGVSKHSLYAWKRIGPVAYLCRSECSFKRPSVQKRPDFSSLMLSAGAEGYRTH